VDRCFRGCSVYYQGSGSRGCKETMMKRVGTVLYGCLVLALGVMPGYGQVIQAANQRNPGFVVQPVGLQARSVAMSGVEEPVEGRMVDDASGQKPNVVSIVDGDGAPMGTMMSGCGGCGDCGGCCGGCGDCCGCCDDGYNAWRHRNGFFGEFLYLRAFGVDM